MNNDHSHKVTITLPQSVYHRLRNEANRKGISLPEFIKKKVQLEAKEASPLANLPIKQILAATAPDLRHPDERIDFFS